MAMVGDGVVILVILVVLEERRCYYLYIDSEKDTLTILLII